MTPRLFKDVKNELARVAGQTGFKADDPRLKDQVNLAQERLLQEGNWPGILERCCFCTYNGIIVLPEKYDTLVRVALDKTVRTVADNWYEFMEYGPGPQCPTGTVTTTAIDQGESPVVYQPEGKYLKVFGGGATVYADGLTVTLAPGSATTEAEKSATTYKHITRVDLDSTGSQVELVYVDAAGNEFLGARYSGDTARPSLRMYKVPAATGSQTCDALLRRRFTPVVDDETPLLISNLPALRNMLISLFKEETGELELAEAYLQRAVISMRAENRRYFGSEEPAMNISSSIHAFGDISPV